MHSVFDVLGPLSKANSRSFSFFLSIINRISRNTFWTLWRVLADVSIYGAFHCLAQSLAISPENFRWSIKSHLFPTSINGVFSKLSMVLESEQPLTFSICSLRFFASWKLSSSVILIKWLHFPKLNARNIKYLLKSLSKINTINVHYLNTQMNPSPLRK